jgi:hypothetical protein
MRLFGQRANSREKVRIHKFSARANFRYDIIATRFAMSDRP